MVSACGFSPDSTRIVSASFPHKTVTVWDAASGVVLATLTGHTNGVTACGFSPDGTRIVSGSNDGTLKVWNAESGPVVVTAGQRDGRLVVRCPACWREQPLEPGRLGSVVSCPTRDCGLELRLNTFVLTSKKTG